MKHPSKETLLRASLGDLPEDQSFELREHLLDCRSCADKFRSLMDDSDVAPEADLEVSETQQEAAWQRLKSTLEDQGVAADQGSSSGPSVKTGSVGNKAGDRGGERDNVVQLSTGSKHIGRWQAAAILAVGLGLGYQVYPHFGPGESLHGPRLGTRSTVESIIAKPIARDSGDSADRELTCPEFGDDWSWKILLSDEGIPDQKVVVRISDPSGDTESLEAVLEDGQLTLARARSERPAGRYRLRIQPADGSGEEIEVFDIVVQCSEMR